MRVTRPSQTGARLESCSLASPAARMLCGVALLLVVIFVTCCIKFLWDVGTWPACLAAVVLALLLLSFVLLVFQHPQLGVP